MTTHPGHQCHPSRNAVPVCVDGTHIELWCEGCGMWLGGCHTPPDPEQNEQWPHYWALLFESEGYSVSGALRWAIWNDDRVENWYRQNLLVCARPGYHPPELFGSSVLAEPLAVVHPVLFDHVRSR